ncbi:MAG: hypothetical protein N2316_04800 [Spirochaetes bacterium]|nr:hypothetical protein [Spirochaetota bacterium]
MHHENPKSVSQSMSSTASESGLFLERLAQSIASSEEFDRIVLALVPQLLSRWAGKNVVKRAVARVASKSIQKSFSVERNIKISQKLLEDREFAKAALKEFPHLANNILSSLQIVLKSIAGLPHEDKEILMGEFIAKIDGSIIANIFTQILKTINDLHASNPKFFAEHLSPLVSSYLKEADFGELKEAIEKSACDVEEFVKRINEVLWEYPAKVICILAIIPVVLNIAITLLKETLAPVNKLAPDLLSDVIFSLVSEIDGKRFASFANELFELVRKIHTGNALLGEPGKPQLPKVVGNLFDDIVQGLDIDLFVRAFELYQEIKHMVFLTQAEIFENKTEFVQKLMRARLRSWAYAVKKTAKKLEVLETAFYDDDEIQKVAEGTMEVDPQEVAIIVERICALYNRLKKQKPDFFQNFASQFFCSLNSEEIAEAVSGMVADIVASFRPIAPQVLPPLIRGFADMISEEDSSDMRNAVEKLKIALFGKEVQK